MAHRRASLSLLSALLVPLLATCARSVGPAAPGTMAPAPSATPVPEACCRLGDLNADAQITLPTSTIPISTPCVNGRMATCITINGSMAACAGGTTQAALRTVRARVHFTGCDATGVVGPLPTACTVAATDPLCVARDVRYHATTTFGPNSSCIQRSGVEAGDVTCPTDGVLQLYFRGNLSALLLPSLDSQFAPLSVVGAAAVKGPDGLPPICRPIPPPVAIARCVDWVGD